MVSEMGLEPTWCEPYEPESYASTNFATQTFLLDFITNISKKYSHLLRGYIFLLSEYNII